MTVAALADAGAAEQLAALLAAGRTVRLLEHGDIDVRPRLPLHELAELRARWQCLQSAVAPGHAAWSSTARGGDENG